MAQAISAGVDAMSTENVASFASQRFLTAADQCSTRATATAKTAMTI